MPMRAVTPDMANVHQRQRKKGKTRPMRRNEGSFVFQCGNKQACFEPEAGKSRCQERSRKQSCRYYCHGKSELSRAVEHRPQRGNSRLNAILGNESCHLWGLSVW